MKKMRKIFALLLAVAMVFTMATAVLAAGDGTITINEATKDETYKLYKVFDATGTDDTSVAYTYTKADGTDTLYDELIKEESPFTLTQTSAVNKYNVSLKTNKTASDVSAFLKANEGKLGIVTEMKASGDVVTFNNLDYGYYYISKASATEQPGPTVGVTSVAPSQTINDKSANPGPITPDENNPGGFKVIQNSDGKLTHENTANYGDTVNFILQAQATNYAEGKKIVEYTAYDILGEGYTGLTVTKVTVGGTELATTAYTFDGATTTSPATVTIPWVDGEGNHVYASPTVINVYCSAVVNENAVIGETGSNTTNIAWFNWKYDNGTKDKPDPTDPTTPPTEIEDETIVTTKVYAIAINKTDKKGTALAGANFEISKMDGENEVKIPVSVVNAGDENNSAIYKYDATSTNYTVVSPVSGRIVIKGLEGINYIVRETVAPAGYNIIDTKVDIEASEFSKSSTTMTLYYDIDGNLTTVDKKNTENTITFDEASQAINVINYAGTELPSTGGIGTTIFYVLGGLLAVSAVILIVTKKRMSMER